MLVPGLSVVVSVDTRAARAEEEDEEPAEEPVAQVGPGGQVGRSRSAGAKP